MKQGKMGTQTKVAGWSLRHEPPMNDRRPISCRFGPEGPTQGVSVEPGTLTRRMLLVAGASALVAGSAWGRFKGDRPIILGQVSLSFYAVTGAVVHEVLNRLGHSVEVRQGPHEEMFPLLGQGAIDLMAAAWLPEGHAVYWARYGTGAEEVAKLYDGARFFWSVPDYVPESEVTSIADLAKPSVATRMTKLIQGIGTGATITTVSEKAVGEYGLDALGYSLRPGTPAQWTGAYDAAVAERRWIVFPTWAPQYLNRGGKLRPLQDPRGVLGGINHAALVGPRNRLQAIPRETRAVLARIDLGLEGVTEMDWLVNVEKKLPREAARTWMKANEIRVAGWLRA
jgi:glycine betaine/proline transport system substrate-binding protein